MSDHLGFLEIECDAPPYPIVRACRKLDLSEPEDVRWCRKGSHNRRPHSWIQSLTSPIWERLMGRSEPEDPSCVCGSSLPVLECYCFTFQSGEKAEYEVGQCPRCRTIHWKRM